MDPDDCTWLFSTSSPTDQDYDGVPDSEDNCLFTYNPEQEDTGNTGIGDACRTTFASSITCSICAYRWTQLTSQSLNYGSLIPEEYWVCASNPDTFMATTWAHPEYTMLLTRYYAVYANFYLGGSNPCSEGLEHYMNDFTAYTCQISTVPSCV